MEHDLLAIYLTDHLAGAAAGSRRVRRLADAERASDDGLALRRVADEIDEDRETLVVLMRVEGVAPRRYKAVVARIAEAAGLLKRNGTLVRRSPLTSVVELEALLMGVTGKHALWDALQHTELTERHDFGSLKDRADRQLKVLRDAHTRRAGVLSRRERVSAPSGRPR